MSSLNVISQSGAPSRRGAGSFPAIQNIVAIASGKGGVGKSTVARALHAIGVRVGIVDADILGPSVPTMLGVPVGMQPPSDGQMMIPPQNYGVKVISMSMLTDHDQPAILRGPMVSKYIEVFFKQVSWGELDCLLVDLPPGTGDIPLLTYRGGTAHRWQRLSGNGRSRFEPGLLLLRVFRDLGSHDINGSHG